MDIFFQQALHLGFQESIVRAAVSEYFELTKQPIPDPSTLMQMINNIETVNNRCVFVFFEIKFSHFQNLKVFT